MNTKMRSYMDDYSKKSTFTLQELKSDGGIFTSYFDTKDKAKSYARRYCDDYSTIYIYKTYCIKIYDPVVEQEVEQEVYDLSTMTVWKYGSGYLLVPQEDSEYFGNKYFHDGWWIKSQKGWFFKTQHYQWIMDNGAIISVEEDGVDEETDLSSMILWSYGKGYILEPPKESELFGEKYFHSGWWMNKQNGWFFKACEYDWLVDNGVMLSEDEQIDSQVDTTDISSMTLRSYGKGYLLMPPKTELHYGEKYFHDGWWMPKQRGWFFKQEFKQWLLEHGAKTKAKAKAKTKATTKATAKAKAKATAKATELSEYDLDISDMSITKYGLGYMLYTSESDSRYGQKYFMTGFWNTKAKGWFFKTKYFDELVTMGATVIKSEPEQVTSTAELSSSSVEYVHDDSEFMTSDTKPVPKFVKYGKGWILKEDDHYKHNGNDYFEGGWWIPKIKAWFFKSAVKQKFMKKHFEI
jgi:hypothetical protein